MFGRVLGFDESPAALLLFLVFGGLTIYFVLSGASYLLFFVLGHERFHPTYQADPRANRSAMKLGALGTLGNALLMLPFQLLIANGYGRIYWDVAEHGWAWLALSFVLYLTFTETCIYWIHRALHTELGYRWLHQYHHEWKVPTPWVSMAFHPLDSFLQALPHHLFGFLFPLHGLVYMTMLAFVSLWSVMIHDRVSLVRSGLINYTGNHTLHHWFGEYNYGQFFTIWDRLMGTWHDPELAGRGDGIPYGVLVRTEWAIERSAASSAFNRG
jgi:lathosterol oxidase